MKTIRTNCQHGNFNASAEPGLAEYSKMIQQIEPGLNTEDADATFWDSVSVVMCSELEWCSGVNSWYMKSFIRALTPIAVASLFKHLLTILSRDATRCYTDRTPIPSDCGALLHSWTCRFPQVLHLEDWRNHAVLLLAQLFECKNGL